MSKSKNTARKSLHSESKTGSLTMPQYSAISEHSLIWDLRTFTGELWMSSQQDSPVSPFQLQENKRVEMMTVIDGLTPLQSFASYDPDSASWKTSQGCLVSGMREEFSETWPKQGIMQDGVCWELTMFTAHIKGKGCGLWPTPDSNQRGNRSYQATMSGERQVNLQDAVKWWPTPTKQDGENNGGPSQFHRNSLPLNAIVKKFPTPQASMMTDADMEQARYAGNNKNRPEYKDAGKGSLNPDWVEWLMGWPVGWSSLEPTTELLWLDWSVDPADMEEPKNWKTPKAVMPDNLSSNPKISEKGRIIRKSGENYGMNLKDEVSLSLNSTGPIPRVATGIKDRVNRLKAIGNGQVPQVAALAWKILTNNIVR